jgi:cytochrome c5
VSESRESQYSASHDKHFFDTFMLVLGGLVAFAFALYFLARVVGANTQERNVLQDPAHVAAANANVRPVALLAVSGRDNSAVEPAAPPPAAKAAPAAVMAGDAVYNMACVACHGQGIGGAPIFGNKEAWAPRIAQGSATLQEHALKGYQGKAGLMPAKGGRVDLADESIVNAVDYMVNAAK